jgi:uncharacterized protein (DUF305 family)
MNASPVTRRSFLALCAAFLAFTSGGFASGPAPERDERRFEIDFLTGMIDHHYGAVKMAELCDGRTMHNELLDLCHSIKATQTTEISTMQSWLQSWYGVTHQPALDAKTQREITQLSQLTGADFEKAFMADMIMHHAEAISRGREAPLQAWHADLLNMVAKMVGSQADEIVQMRLWLIQWYGINDLDHTDHP